MANKKPGEENAMAGNVDQIREIIFGGHIREYESRFAALEKSLKQAQAELRKDFESQLAALRKSLEKTGAALEQERLDRQNADEGLDGLLQNQGGEIGRQLDQVEKTFGERADGIASELEGARKALESQLEKQGNATKRDLDKLSQRLENSKVARNELAKLLSGVAGELSGESAPKARRK